MYQVKQGSGSIFCCAVEYQLHGIVNGSFPLGFEALFQTFRLMVGDFILKIGQAFQVGCFSDSLLFLLLDQLLQALGQGLIEIGILI